MSPFRARWPVVLLALAAGSLAIAAGLMIFSAFMMYDDEGYVLFSLKNFAEHGHLYRDVYSQYGPFPYVLYALLHAFGLPFTHLAGRIVTLVSWAGSASLCGALVWKATRSVACALAAQAGAYAYLWVMASEPTHPGGLIALLTAALAAFGYPALAAGRNSRWAAGAGAAIGALLLTKVNVGIFALLSAGSLWALDLRSLRLRRAAPWIVGAGFAILPFLLMRPLLGTPWIDVFAESFALSAVPLAAAAAQGAPGRMGWREPVAAAAGGGAVAAIVVGAALAKGSTFHDLLQGIILRPLSQPAHFSLPYHWIGGTPVAAASFALFILTAALLRRAALRPRIVAALAFLKLTGGAGMIAALLTFPGASPDRMVMAFAAPCLWFLVWPLREVRTDADTARSWLGLLYLGQWLHAYPVAGSQIAWGTFLAIPLAAIAAWEGFAWLRFQAALRSPGSSAAAVGEGGFAGGRSFGSAGPLRRWALGAGLALMAFSAVMEARLARAGFRYFTGPALDLPGTELIRLPEAPTSAYQLLCLNAAAHADVLFSLPGMFSFNLWTGIPAPTYANVTHWFSLLTPGEQGKIRQSLEDHPRACIIVQTGHLRFLALQHVPVECPLYDYIMSHYETAFAVDDFEFLVRRGRKILPLQTVQLFQGPPDSAGGSQKDLLRMSLLLPPRRPVARIHLAPMDGQPGYTWDLGPGDCVVSVTPVDLRGQLRSAPRMAKLPLELSGPTVVEVYFQGGGRPIDQKHTWAVLQDAAGGEIAYLRFTP